MLWRVRHDELRVDRVLKEKYLSEISSCMSVAKNIYESDKYILSVAQQFSNAFQYPNVTFTGSGTESFSFLLWLTSGNIRSAQEIIVPSIEYASILSSFSLFPKIKIQLCDVNPETFTIDAEAVQEHITDSTKGLISAHMFGNAAPMQALQKIKKKHGFVLIEDVCQAVGNKLDDTALGNFGDLSFFSFSHSKMLSSFGKGKGGAFAIRDELYLDSAAQLTKQKTQKGISSMSLGEAAGIRVKLEAFADMIKYHQRMKAEYRELLEEIEDIQIINSAESQRGLGTKMVVLFKNQRIRDTAYESLRKEGILPELPYTPLHILLQSKEKFPHAESYYQRALHLPFFIFIRPEEIESIVKAVRQALA